MKKRSANWIGKIESRFRWWHLRFEAGRVCRIRDGLGNIIHEWWEWAE